MDTKSKARLDLTALLRSRSEFAGLWSSVFVGYGGDISYVRPYQPGDKIRQIHRPSFARGELMTKEFFGERRMAIRLMLDIARSTTPIGGFEPIYAKAARDALELFSDLIQGAADFWGISVSQGNMLAAQVRGSLVFLVSDFYEGPESYASFLEHARNIRADVIPVFINTSWIWHDLRDAGAEFRGVDVLGESEGFISMNKKTASRVRACLLEREERLGMFFRKQNMPWINLRKPDFSDYVREMTRCCTEKYRTHA